jgi:hypothetical protein
MANEVEVVEAVEIVPSIDGRSHARLEQTRKYHTYKVDALKQEIVSARKNIDMYNQAVTTQETFIAERQRLIEEGVERDQKLVANGLSPI